MTAFLLLPALLLSLYTSIRVKDFSSAPKLFVLYFIYGIARAYSLTRTLGRTWLLSVMFR
jgi:hypothetical protein